MKQTLTQSSAQTIAEQFSRLGKIAKTSYLAKEPYELGQLEAIVTQLAATKLSLENDDQKKAFFVNLYNGFTNYLIVKKKLSGGLITNLTMFFLPKITIGNYKFSLDDIEHGILRRNRKASYKLSKQFSSNDKRLDLMVDALDYRIHFALNCGAISCPPIAFYSVEKVEDQLALAEISFAEQNFKVNLAKRKIQYSKLYDIYREDFQNRYLDDPQYQGFKFLSLKYHTAFG